MSWRFAPVRLPHDETETTAEDEDEEGVREDTLQDQVLLLQHELLTARLRASRLYCIYVCLPNFTLGASPLPSLHLTNTGRHTNRYRQEERERHRDGG